VSTGNTRNAVSELRAAIGFLTPLGRSSPAPSPKTMAYFPVVGAVMGCALGNVWRSLGHRYKPLPAAALAVAADCALTGALHLDGLADAADGLLAHAPTKDRLEIMAEPGTGAFAAAAVALAVTCRAAAMSAIEPSALLLAAVYCSSRSVMGLGARSLPYARSTGLATAFLPDGEQAAAAAALGTPPPQPGSPAFTDPVLAACLGGLGAACAFAYLSARRRGAVALAVGWAASACVLGTARRRIGGFTGDVLGAAGVVCEVTTLLALAKQHAQKGDGHWQAL